MCFLKELLTKVNKDWLHQKTLSNKKKQKSCQIGSYSNLNKNVQLYIYLSFVNFNRILLTRGANNFPKTRGLKMKLTIY